MTKQTGRPEASEDRVEAFVNAWIRERSPFATWVRDVAQAFASSSLQPEGAAHLVGTTPAELEAVLKLATMEDDDLELLNPHPPSKTTWFLLADATNDGVVAAIDALGTGSANEPPSQVVIEALRTVEGPPAAERIAALPAATLGHLAKKAKQYDLLTPKARAFLGSIATRKKSGQSLTPRQVAYAQNLIDDLIAGGALKRKSPDNDQKIVDEILDAVDSR
jgi:hypothetical protein